MLSPYPRPANPVGLGLGERTNSTRPGVLDDRRHSGLAFEAYWQPMLEAGRYNEITTAPTPILIDRPVSARPSAALPLSVSVLGPPNDVGPSVVGRARGMTLSNGLRKMFGGVRGAVVAAPRPVNRRDQDVIVIGGRDDPHSRSPSDVSSHSVSILPPPVLPSALPCVWPSVPPSMPPSTLTPFPADLTHYSPDVQIQRRLPLLNMSYEQLLEAFPHVVAQLNTPRPSLLAVPPSPADDLAETRGDGLIDILEGNDHLSALEPCALTPFSLDASPSLSTASPEVVTPELPLSRISCDHSATRLSDVDKPLPSPPITTPEMDGSRRVGAAALVEQSLEVQHLLSPFRQLRVRPSTGTFDTMLPFGAQIRLRVRPSTAQASLDVEPSPARYGSQLLSPPFLADTQRPLVTRSSFLKSKAGAKVYAEGQEPVEYLAPNYLGPPSSAFSSYPPSIVLTPPSEPVVSTSRLASASVDSFASAATFKSTFSSDSAYRRRNAFRTRTMFREVFRAPEPTASDPEAYTPTVIKKCIYTADGRDVQEVVRKALNERPLGEKVRRRLIKWRKGVGEVVRNGAMFGPMPAVQVDRKGKGREV